MLALSTEYSDTQMEAHSPSKVPFRVQGSVASRGKIPIPGSETNLRDYSEPETIAEPPLPDTTEERVRPTDEIEPSSKDLRVHEEIDKFFTQNMDIFKESFVTKAIQKLTLSEMPASKVAEVTEYNAESTNPSDKPNVQSASQGERPRRQAPKKRANDGSDDGDDHRSGNNQKKQKEAHNANGATDTRKLACPFRKHNPAMYGLGNARYKTCATGSWENVGKLK